MAAEAEDAERGKVVSAGIQSEETDLMELTHKEMHTEGCGDF